MGTSLQAFYKHFYISSENTKTAIFDFVKKKKNYFLIQAGRSVNRQGAAPSEICLAETLSVSFSVCPLAPTAGTKYELDSSSGEGIACIFVMSVTVDGQTFNGAGRSKKLAKARAAQDALQHLFKLQFDTSPGTRGAGGCARAPVEAGGKQVAVRDSRVSWGLVQDSCEPGGSYRIRVSRGARTGFV